MYKQMLLLVAMAIGSTSSILPVTFSNGSMYMDIKNIVSNAYTGDTDQKRYANIIYTLDQLDKNRRLINESILKSYASLSDNKTIALFFGGIGITTLAATAYVNHVNNITAIDKCGMFGIISSITGLFLYYGDCVKIYLMKKKVAEINEVITKLETMKTELANKLGIVETQQI